MLKNNTVKLVLLLYKIKIFIINSITFRICISDSVKYSKFGFRRKIETIKMKESNLNNILDK